QRIDQHFGRRPLDRIPVGIDLVLVEVAAKARRQTLAIDADVVPALFQIAWKTFVARLHLALGRRVLQLALDLEARDARESNQEAAVTGLAPRRQLPETADRKQRGLRVAGARLARLDHADYPCRAQRLIDHRQIPRLEDVERQPTARQQQRAGQREDRNDL